MMENEIIEEIRKVREVHAQQLDFDLDRIAADIRRGERTLRANGWKIVRRRAKKPTSTRGS